MGVVDLGTATGKVRFVYESSGAERVTKEFEKVKKQTEGSVSPFTKWAEKAGIGSDALKQYNQLQERVNESTKAAKVFEQNLQNVRARSNSTLKENYRANMLAEASKKSLADLKNLAAQVEKQLPMSMASAGSKSAEEFKKSFQAAGIKGMSDSGSKLSGALFGGLKDLGKAAGGAAVAAIGVTLTKGFGRLEKIDAASFKLKALGHDAKSVSAIMKSATEAVNKTSYALDDAATIAAGAVAAGIKPGKELTQYISNIADSAAIANVPLSSMGNIFNGIVATNKVYIGDLTQLGGQGIPIIQALAKEYGVTESELSDMVTRGEVDSAHFLAAISKNFSGAAKTMGGSIDGAISNVKTAISRLGANILAPLFGQSGSGEQGNALADGINKIQEAIDGLSGFIKEHQSELVDFWGMIAKAGLMAWHVILDVVSFITDAIIKLTEVFGDLTGWIADAIESVAGLFGAKGIQENMRKFSDEAHSWGKGLRENRDKNLPGFFTALDNGKKNLQDWIDKSKGSAAGTDDLGDSADKAAPKVKTIDQALADLGITLKDAQKGIEGSAEDFEALIAALEKNKAPKELIDTVKRLRQEFDNGGRGAKQFADAVQKLGDKTASADDKADSLIDSLRTLGVIPAGDALKDYNKTMQETTDISANLVDVLDATGSALVRQNGEINTSTKNGATLLETLERQQKDAFKLAASGEANPADVWQRTHDGMMLVLQTFGIFGDQAEQIVRKYLTDPHEFEIVYKAKNFSAVDGQLTSLYVQLDAAKQSGKNQIDFTLNIPKDQAEELKKQVESFGGIWKQYDPITGTAQVQVPNLDVTREGIEKNLKDKPAQLDSELNVTTKGQDIVNEVTGGPGNALHIPTVLDVQNPEVVPGGKPGVIGGGAGKDANHPPGSTDLIGPGGSLQTPKPKDNGFFGGSIGPDNGSLSVPLTLEQRRALGIPDNLPDVYPGAAPNQGYQNTGAPQATLTPDQQANLLNLGNNPDALNRALSDNPEIANQLQGIVNQANAQGQNMAEAFAQGILSGSPAVKEALLQLAQEAGNYLGNSPAKYGPLSGKGWTLERGKTFTKAWAQGIASEAGTAKGATEGMVSSSTQPFGDQFEKFIKDIQEFSDFGKHALDFLNQVSDIAFNSLKLANDLSGDKLFPKSYVPDPNFKKAAPRLAPWDPSTSGQAGQPRTAQQPANGEVAVPLVQNPDGTWTSPNAAWAHLIARESSGVANIRQGIQDPNSGGNEAEGLFQITPKTWKANGGEEFAKSAIAATAQQQAIIAARIFNKNPSGSDWGAGLPNREIASELAAGLKQSGVDVYSPANTNPGLNDPATNAATTSLDAFAQSLVGATYEMGGFSKTTIDCSGAVSAFANAATGRDPFSSRASTVDMGQFLAARGFKPGRGGPGDLRVGWWDRGGGANGHTALTLPSGLNAESTTSNGISGFRVGAKAVGSDDKQFTNQMFLPGSAIGGVPVTLVGESGDALQQTAQNTSGMPTWTTALGGLPAGLDSLAKNDDLLRQAIEASRGTGNGITQDQAVRYLQHMDGVISDQSKLNTPEAKAQVSALEGIRSNLMANQGLQEGQSPLDSAQTIANGVSGIASDIFGVVDSTLKSIASAKDIGDTLVRGIANSEDIFNIVDKFKSFIELGQKIAQTVSDVAGFAGQLVGAGSSADPSGSTAGVSAVLGAISGISGIVSQALGAVNSAISLGQEAYRLVTKYMGRFLTEWFGFPGASDMKFLLDEVTGQVQAYTSDNPELKHTYNTLGRELGGTYSERQAPENTFYIYQGPGQDPRDTMSNAMFAIKSSGQGALGYA